MIPTPAEVEALLALPEEARRRLLACKGQGWIITRRKLALLRDDSGGTTEHQGESWLPADSAEILRVAMEWCDTTGECDGVLYTPRPGGQWEAGIGGPECTGETARLACLRLLGEVAKVKAGKEGP